MITQKQLVALADKWEIDFTPQYRMATCADCGAKVYRMWHCWFVAGGYKKEIHLCRKCGKKYNL